jgi:hypothetical protein
VWEAGGHTSGRRAQSSGAGDVQVARETFGDTLVESADASKCGARETECSLGVRMRGSVQALWNSEI